MRPEANTTFTNSGTITDSYDGGLGGEGGYGASGYGIGPQGSNSTEVGARGLTRTSAFLTQNLLGGAGGNGGGIVEIYAGSFDNQGTLAAAGQSAGGGYPGANYGAGGCGGQIGLSGGGVGGGGEGGSGGTIMVGYGTLINAGSMLYGAGTSGSGGIASGTASGGNNAGGGGGGNITNGNFCRPSCYFCDNGYAGGKGGDYPSVGGAGGTGATCAGAAATNGASGTATPSSGTIILKSGWSS